MNTQWATGVAEVISKTVTSIVVRCPHCGDTHNHSRSCLGSKSVVAGCHTGFSRCREYRIIDLGTAKRMKTPPSPGGENNWGTTQLKGK